MIPRLIPFSPHHDKRGFLTVVDNLPFEIERVFYIYDVPEGQSRGKHALRTCRQVLVAVAGSLVVKVDGRLFTLCFPHVGLYIPAMTWREMFNFSPGAVCLVLASTSYDESDYIGDFDEFARLRLQRRGVEESGH